MSLPKRKLPRLKGYDYASEGYYFITICTHNKVCLFGKANELNVYGRIAEKELQNIPLHFEGVRVDRYVVMPNHIHAVL